MVTITGAGTRAHSGLNGILHPAPVIRNAHIAAAHGVPTVLSLGPGLQGRGIASCSGQNIRRGRPQHVADSPTAPGITFANASIEAIADQIDDARIFGGIHTRADQFVGGLLGARVGQYVYESLPAQR